MFDIEQTVTNPLGSISKNCFSSSCWGSSACEGLLILKSPGRSFSVTGETGPGSFLEWRYYAKAPSTKPALRSLDICETDNQKHLSIRILNYYKPEEYIDDYDYTLKK